MGLFDIFKSEKNGTSAKNTNDTPWIALEEMDSLDIIKEASKTKTQVIFKHSTRCGISSMVIKKFEAGYKYQNQVDLYYLDLLNYRPISLAIADKFETEHQSPQLLIVKNGVVVHHSSHNAIHADSIAQYL